MTSVYARKSAKAPSGRSTPIRINAKKGHPKHRSTQVAFNVHRKHLQGSSLFKEGMGPDADGYETTVPMVRIDDVLKEKRLNGPYLIKVDVQGTELGVLEGAQTALADAEAVILEASMFEFMKGAPQFFNVLSSMRQYGFAAYDILPAANRPLDNALGQVEMVFVKERGRFRQNHSYSTLEQAKLLKLA